MTDLSSPADHRSLKKNITFWIFGILLATVTAFAHFLLHKSDTGWMTDMYIYVTGSQLEGTALYTQPVGPYELLFQYPPITADMFGLLAGWDINLLGILWNTLNLVGLQVVIWACVTALGTTPLVNSIVILTMTAVSPLFEPISNTLLVGQVDLLLMTLVLIDLVLIRTPKHQGICIGLAAAIKLVPGIFILYLIVSNKFRAAGNAFATFLLLLTAGFITRPVESSYFWTHLGASPKGEDAAQIFSRSTWSVLLRATQNADALQILRVIMLGAVLVSLFATILALQHARRRTRAVTISRDTGLGSPAFLDVLTPTCLALAVALVLPIAWVHYWVWAVPLIVLCSYWAWSRASISGWVGIGLLVVVFTFRFHSWGIGLEQSVLTLSPLQILQTGVYPVATFVLLMTIAWLVRSESRAPVAVKAHNRHASQ